MMDKLIKELQEIFGSEGLTPQLSKELVEYLDTEGFLDYDVLKEIYGEL